MNKVAFVMIAALLLGLGTVAFAQEFPDVPPDHWAYDAVQELVDQGIIQGYPDGTFGGKRAMTRYEFAEALAKAIPVIIDMMPSDSTSQGMKGDKGDAGAPGVKGDKGEPGVGAEQLASIQKMMDEFQDELASLGVQVESVRRDLNALTERVGIIEEEQARVKINADTSLIVRGEVANGPVRPTFDKDARLIGNNGNPNERDNPLSNSSFFNDFQLGIVGKVAENTSVDAQIAAGNYLQDFALPGVDDFTLWKLTLNTAMKLGPLGQGEVTVGRFPFQLTPLTLKLVDTDSYTYVSKLDDGNFVLDGGNIMFNWSKISLTAFAAKVGDNVIADLITPDLLLGGAGGVDVSQIGGARAVIGITADGGLGLTWYQAGVGVGGVNATTDVMGADINLMFGSIGLMGEWAQTSPDDTLNGLFAADLDNDNTAWNASLAFQAGSLGIKGGYSDIEQNYDAPGNWSRLGAAANLVNVKGPMANLTYALTDNISLSAEGQWLDPNDDTAGLSVDGRTATTQGRTVGVAANALDKITYWKAGLKYGLTSSNTVDLGFEQVTWEPTGAGTTDTEERYISLGLGHTFNPNASMKLLYQIVEYEDGTLTPYGVSNNFHGGVATAQFAVKF